VGWGFLQLSRTSGQPDGQRPGFTAKYLCSHMSVLRLRMKPSFDCPSDDLSNDAFV
jgi:hypothetical protein